MFDPNPDFKKFYWYQNVFFTVIQLQFEKVSYTFSESTTVNDTVITIMIANYDELEITNDTFVPVVAMITGSNATQGDGMCVAE